MEKRLKAFRIVSIAVPIVLSVALVAACVYGARESVRAAEYERRVQNSYRQAFLELSDNVNDMQVSLKKLLVVSTPQRLVLLLDDVWRLAGQAEANLSALPVSHAETEAFNRFVVQTGDYARALSAKVLSGAILQQEDRDQLFDLYEASVQTVAHLENRLQSGDFPVDSLDMDGFYTETETEDEESIANYPTLIYDGPFSDSSAEIDLAALGETEVSGDAALQAAADYVGGSLTLVGEAAGSIPTYEFFGTDANGRSVELSVTKRGGHVLYMMGAVESGAEGKPDQAEDEAMQRAAKLFLDARGYENMEPTYAQYYGGTAVYNFASVQGGVVLYSDLIKVYVERGTNGIIGVDARDYLLNHRERTLPIAAIDEAEARDRVSEALSVDAVRLALIPKTPTTEVLCYECHATFGDAVFLVYIHAQTGAEEEIFEIIDAEDGDYVV